MESMGIYKNESMESMGSVVFSSILLLIISGKHGKHGKKAWKSIGNHGKAWRNYKRGLLVQTTTFLPLITNPIINLSIIYLTMIFLLKDALV